MTTETIATEIDDLMQNKQSNLTMPKAINPYGDGLACNGITDTLNAYLA